MTTSGVDTVRGMLETVPGEATSRTCELRRTLTAKQPSGAVVADDSPRWSTPTACTRARGTGCPSAADTTHPRMYVVSSTMLTSQFQVERWVSVAAYAAWLGADVLASRCAVPSSSQRPVVASMLHSPMLAGAAATAACGIGNWTFNVTPDASRSAWSPCRAVTSMSEYVSNSVSAPPRVTAVKSPGKARYPPGGRRVHGRDRHRHVAADRGPGGGDEGPGRNDHRRAVGRRHGAAGRRGQRARGALQREDDVHVHVAPVLHRHGLDAVDPARSVRPQHRAGVRRHLGEREPPPARWSSRGGCRSAP